MAYGRDPDEKMFDKLSKNKDLERGLQQIQANPAQDPVVRQMAETVLRECEKAKKRRGKQAIGVVIAIVAAIILIILKHSLSKTEYGDPRSTFRRWN